MKTQVRKFGARHLSTLSDEFPSERLPYVIDIAFHQRIILS
mgnify:CR=1 FL=1